MWYHTWHTWHHILITWGSTREIPSNEYSYISWWELQWFSNQHHQIETALQCVMCDIIILIWFINEMKSMLKPYETICCTQHGAYNNLLTTQYSKINGHLYCKLLAIGNNLIHNFAVSNTSCATSYLVYDGLNIHFYNLETDATTSDNIQKITSIYLEYRLL